MIDSKWIKFIPQQPVEGRKTLTYDVRTKDTDFKLGEIKWYGPFRAYSFFPEAGCVFEVVCLGDIISFIKDLMEQRKIEKAAKEIV